MQSLVVYILYNMYITATSVLDAEGASKAATTTLEEEQAEGPNSERLSMS
jgi:hypothetical protein